MDGFQLIPHPLGFTAIFLDDFGRAIHTGTLATCQYILNGVALLDEFACVFASTGSATQPLPLAKANIVIVRECGKIIAHIATKAYLCTQKHVINMNKTIQVVAAIIHDSEGRIFATQRGYGDFKDYWEFPGGKMEAGETAEEALKREIWEELETRIVVERFVMTVEWDYPQFHLTMQCYLCHVESGHLELKEHEAARWLSKDELENVEWLPADLQIITLLRDS